MKLNLSCIEQLSVKGLHYTNVCQWICLTDIFDQTKRNFITSNRNHRLLFDRRNTNCSVSFTALQYPVSLMHFMSIARRIHGCNRTKVGARRWILLALDISKIGRGNTKYLNNLIGSTTCLLATIFIFLQMEYFTGCS